MTDNIHCQHGDHHLHDEGAVDDNGECPGLRPVDPYWHPDCLLTDEEWTAKNAGYEERLKYAGAKEAEVRIQRYAVYGHHVEAPDAEDFAALKRVNLTAEHVISWLPARESDADGRAR